MTKLTYQVSKEKRRYSVNDVETAGLSLGRGKANTSPFTPDEIPDGIKI